MAITGWVICPGPFKRKFKFMYMREYKFRGKRIDNGEWVVGKSLSIEYDETCFISYWKSECTDASVNLWEPVEMWHEVIPETVGQFTGLKDKNGVDVYEGDLYTPNYGHPNEFYPVMFISGAFVGGNSPEHCEPLGWEDGNIDKDLWFSVVGNIHDNPELLNPLADSPALNTMNIDPNVKAEEVKEQPADAVAPEQVTQESAEEGTTEG